MTSSPIPTLVHRAEDDSVLEELFQPAREAGDVLTPLALNILWLAVVFSLVFETIKLFFWLVRRLLMLALPVKKVEAGGEEGDGAQGDGAPHS
ncbi:hypothetical protein PENFLA_c059G10111 [Penicillium flavigenum]|uniref:Uncharacterized protein n=1 Tax=Penicillium flavigenum TaxID=254877 RepID=A0A1V6SH43_9EURO|nr:hypothetical protein PENFLA_c059G10111 [Penicillium flavigenum]